MQPESGAPLWDAAEAARFVHEVVGLNCWGNTQP